MESWQAFTIASIQAEFENSHMKYKAKLPVQSKMASGIIFITGLSKYIGSKISLIQNIQSFLNNASLSKNKYWPFFKDKQEKRHQYWSSQRHIISIIAIIVIICLWSMQTKTNWKYSFIFLL